MRESPIGRSPLLIIVLALPPPLFVIVIEGDREKSVRTKERETIKKLEEKRVERVEN